MTQTETDIDAVIAYIKSVSDFDPSKEMLQAITAQGKLEMFQFRAWKEAGIIKGLRVFMKVLCPFQRAQGWAMTLDFCNGYPIDLDLGLAATAPFPEPQIAV